MFCILASRMLYAFVQDQRKDQNGASLSILYIVGGLIKTDNGSLVCTNSRSTLTVVIPY